MQTNEDVKKQVRERYGEAVTTGKSCCGSSPAGEFPADRVVQFAGYRPEELKVLPAEAVSNSFGCGNPLLFADVQAGQTVVDIGSGAGIDCFLAAQRVGPNGKVIGIDMTPQMLAKARENAEKAGVKNVEFRAGEAEKMPIEDNSADWIISNCVINLSPDKPSVFREAFRVLRSGGQLSISDIMVEDLPEFLRDSVDLYCSCVAGAISEKLYVEGLLAAGFQDVQVTERIVYDREQILSLLPETDLLKKSGVNLPDPAAMIEQYFAGKIWSSRITARKP